MEPAAPLDSSPGPPGPAAADHGVARNARLAFAGSALGGALTLCNEVLCARFLGVEAYGLYALALVLARIAEVVAVSGLPVAILRQLAIARESRDAAAISGTVLAAVLPPLAVGSLLGFVLSSLADDIARHAAGAPGAAAYIRAAAWAVPFMALSEVLGAVARGLGRAGYYVVIRNLVPPVVFGAIVLVLVARDAQPPRIPLAFGLAYLAASLVAVACVRRAGRGVLRASGARLPFAALYGYAAPILANNLLYLVVGASGLVMLALVRTEAEVGIFRASMQVLMPFELVELAFVAALGGVYAMLSHAGRGEELRELAERTTRWIALAALALLALLVLARGDLLRIMGPGFAAGADALAILLAGQALLLCTGSLAILLVSCGRQRVETANVAGAAVAGLALNALWVPQHGLVGAAFATALPCAAVAALRVAQVRRLLGIAIWRARPVRALAGPAIAAIAAVAISALLPAPEGPAGWHVARVAIVAAIVALFFWAVALDAQERSRVLASARSAISPRVAGP